MELPKNARGGQVHMVDAVKVRKMPALWGQKETASALNWSMLDARILAAAVQVILDADCAIMIGTTRDHTAVTLAVYVGKDKATTYIGTVAKLEESLQEAIDAFASKSEDVRVLFGIETPQV